MKKIFFALIILISFYQNSNAQSERMVLLEVFTSTTCPPCATANTFFDNWYKTFAQANKVAVIKYHVWWPSPGNDPFYAQNRGENKARNNFYANNYAPHGFVNGNKDAQDGASNWISLINSELSKPTNISISINWKQNNLNSGVVTVKVTPDTNATFLNVTYVLHTSIVENNIAYTGTNHDPMHSQVMKKMFPSDTGLTITLARGISNEYSFPVEIASYWKAENCQFVSFVQIKETKEVLNAARFVGKILNAKEDEIIPNKFALLQNYPNPFNPSTKIKFQIPQNEKIKLSVINSLGVVVENILSKELKAGNYEINFDGKNLPSGIYFYTLETSKNKITKKMVLMK